MEDDFDEFFDSPRHSQTEKNNWKKGHVVVPECTANEDLQCDKDLRKPVGKPPTHPNSRPHSAASKRTLSGRTSPTAVERNFTADPQAHSSRRVIEAKVPCDLVNQDEEDDSDDSFIAEDDGSSTEESSGRQLSTLQAGKAEQQLMSKETSVPDYATGPPITENSAQDLSDYYTSSSDDMTDTDDDSEVTVSPLNTPHSRDVQTTSSRSSSVSKNISKSSSNEPVNLLRGDRDSLDLDMLLQTVLQMEKQGRPQSRQTQTQLVAPSRGSRHNYSFTNERVEAIDKENRRLMTSIMRHANATKKAKAKVKKLPHSSVGTKRLSSAAVNRAKEQQKIEAENLVTVSYTHLTLPTNREV